MSMALFNENYSMPLPVLLFFIIPLIAALLFGRVFCAAVCPLGAIQELVGFRMLKINKHVEKVLTTIPFVYLGLAVLISATGSQFIICRYDPFVGIFRLNAPYTMIIFGSLLLVVGIFVNRPYCRYLCPYGVLQNIFSRFSQKHVTISPAECRNCRLCEPSCPYNAILPSDPVRKDMIPEKTSWKSSLIRILLIPVMAASFAVLMHNSAPSLSGVNNKVQLAREIRLEKKTGKNSVSKAAIAFHESGQTEEQLFSEELAVIERFRKGAPFVGLFLGLSLGIGLFSSSVRNIRTEYIINRGRCVSCGKCFKYCPVKAKA
jgi:ferredoxin